MKRRYIKGNKKYFEFINKYKDIYDIIKVSITKDKYLIIYDTRY